MARPDSAASPSGNRTGGTATVNTAIAHELPPAREGMTDIFFWGVIDWHFRYQRPQHLATALVERGHRVFYVSNNFLSIPQAGAVASPLGDSGRLFQVNLGLAGAPQIYSGMHTPRQMTQLRGGLAEVLRWTRTTSAISIVNYPYWTELASMVPNARLVYDCLDHQRGFDENHLDNLRAEDQLLLMADLVVASSAGIKSEVRDLARSTVVVRNGCDYAFFSTPPPETFCDAQGRRVIGYYGAIEAWFDVALVRAVALAYPDALVLLIGLDNIGAAAALEDVPNVRLTGEVGYRELPYWLYAFDVCMLPFRVIPLTLATNPVKVYEYLAAGKTVVSVDLPEMAQFGSHVRVAADQASFVAALSDALAEAPSEAVVAARREFASRNTWSQRGREFVAALEGIEESRVSVIVLACNNLALTRECLDSIERHSDYGNLEVIVVDNASTDGSREWLQAWTCAASDAGHARRLVLNTSNLGFAAGNNAGLRAATGDVLVLLNNDTRVTPGWIRTLCAHLRRDPCLGLVGPVTDNIGNEAKIVLDPPDSPECAASEYTLAHPGGEFPLRTAAFFCVAMPRAVYEVVGELDEAFGQGFFEDDDYCRRVQKAAYRIACAEDVFIHHHLSASFDRMDTRERDALFERNRRLYEAKWGTWMPHTYRATGG